MYQIMISAGESSGDTHAASLLESLDKTGLQYRCFGMGGRKLAAKNAELTIDFSDLAVMGYVEVLLNYRKLSNRLKTMQQALCDTRPDILVLVDYAGFNLRLAKTARELDIPVLFYISPKIWASRPGRIKEIVQRVSHMALIFPFEVSIYENSGIPATYVGNPLLDQIDASVDAEQSRKALSSQHGIRKIEEKETLIGLIPGSRQSEIRYNLPIMLEAASLLASQREEPCRFILPLASSIRRDFVESLTKNVASKVELDIIDQDSHHVMRASNSLIVVSGTATLEAAVIGTPMVTLIAVHWLNHFILKRMLIADFVSLVNIQAGKEVVRELLQADATPEAIVAETNRLLDDKPYRDNMCKQLSNIGLQMQHNPSPNQATPSSPRALSLDNSGGASDRLATLLIDLLPGHRNA